MTKVTRFCLLAAVVVAVSALAPNADAKCGVNKTIGNYPSAGACGYYCQMTDPGVGLGSIKGDYWVIGAGIDDPPRATCTTAGTGKDSGNYEADGTCGTQGWLAAAGTNAINIGINTDAGNTDGCPLANEHVAVAFSDVNSVANPTQAFFGVGICSMESAGNCDMGLNGSIVMAQIPKPNVTFTSKAGAALTMNVTVPPLPASACVDSTGSGHCPGGAGVQVIQGWDVVRFERPRTDTTTDNNRARASWIPVGSVGLSGGPVTFTCTDTVNANARLGLVPRLDSGFKGDFVGTGSSRIECNPTLADPSTKYKIIDKKPTTTKTPVKQ